LFVSLSYYFDLIDCEQAFDDNNTFLAEMDATLERLHSWKDRKEEHCDFDLPVDVLVDVAETDDHDHDGSGPETESQRHVTDWYEDHTLEGNVFSSNGVAQDEERAEKVREKSIVCFLSV
jgi:hypothetical protein